MTATPTDGPATSRRPSVTVVVALLLVAGGILVSLWRPTAPGLPPVATDLDLLPADLADAIAAYRAPRRVLSLVVTLLAVAVPVGLLAARPGRGLLARVAGARHDGWRGPLRGGLVAVVVVALTSVATLPVQVWAGIVQDGAWQVRRASAAAWWGRWATATLLELAVVGLVGVALVWLVRRRPTAWVGDIVVGGVAAVAAATVVWPAVVLPLTTPVGPLPDTAQAAAVQDIVDAAEVGELRVVVQERSARDTRSNAVVHGLGPTRRIVIDDSLLARPVDEVVAVVAHELAHQSHRDVERAVLASALLIGALAVAVQLVWRRPAWRVRLVGTGRGEVVAHDPRLAAVALAVAAVVGVAAEPVALWQSRRVEASADAAAFGNGADPATTVRLQRRLAIDNLTPMEVPVWEQVRGWSHPTPGQRVRSAVARADRTGAPLPTREELQAEEAADPPAWERPGPDR